MRGSKTKGERSTSHKELCVCDDDSEAYVGKIFL